MLAVAIYRNSTLISTRSVTSPMGAVDLLIDPITARPPGLTANDTLPEHAAPPIGLENYCNRGRLGICGHTSPLAVSPHEREYCITCPDITVRFFQSDMKAAPIRCGESVFATVRTALRNAPAAGSGYRSSRH